MRLIIYMTHIRKEIFPSNPSPAIEKHSSGLHKLYAIYSYVKTLLYLNIFALRYSFSGIKQVYNWMILSSIRYGSRLGQSKILPVPNWFMAGSNPLQVTAQTKLQNIMDYNVKDCWMLGHNQDLTQCA